MTVVARFGDACRVIVPNLGPYAGQRIAVPDEEADHAIDQGWADDPAEATLDLGLLGRGPRPKLLTPARMLELAIAAAARWLTL